LSNPKLYSIGIKNECFNTYIYWRWITYACVQALILLITIYIPFEKSISNKDGNTSGLWMSGAVVYAGVVITANVKLLNSFSSYAFWGEFLVALSIASYFICFWAENLVVGIPELFGIFGITMLNPLTYFCLGLSGLSIYVLDLMIIIFKD
jgi:magnesium-transporting ATPase (P-type)